MSDTTAPPATADAAEVRTWLRECVATYVRLPAEDIDVNLPLSEYGLDSVYVLSLCADIEDRYGIEVEPTLLWDHPAIGPIAEALTPLLAAR
ncbi:acyl carrier protein [Streptomyces sp. NBC_00536]|uniref:acyl carrier protein n=1 Tax=Streptomyces sp. NBC_00536 TaxID=2975769 RepID=UPI002E818AEC|nr:acyl carrier protein [Streptomyces sp. NBC_00536]WUC81827.1 acyl carrier protein [Streptomyces sp. NBC_00536]